MDAELNDARPALQQPDWPDRTELQAVKDELAVRPALVAAHDVRRLRSLLAQVADGEAHVVQAGDCAEDPAECGGGHVARKAGLLDALAGVMKIVTRRPVVRIGRMAGQFGKPRSNPTEHCGGVELPVFRGHMVNSPEPDPARRIPDPRRLLAGYDAARQAMGHLGWLDPSRRSGICPPVWTSHEALLLDYEIPMLRRDEEGGLLLASTHLPWIGERTRQLDGAHVALLSQVANPIACKVGPSMAPDELLRLCELLDPDREPGRLTLIARMGAAFAADRLPALVRRVRASGHPVIWLTDPMHGNTVTAPDGLKTRLVETVVREVEDFQHAVRTAGGTAGGLHLETTPDDVTECAPDASGLARVGDTYTSFCDPRLNPGQAISVVSAWRG
ncbi:phospho-2-dehydro-3-deoxyheptonate aldolase [Peterkaempfera bronchialis]|uniref:Phospho-2-dehydro-3-deoxyheptonate aldolase n=1 Tax=Peterkaempfera bronchialis TaxID=2126346 RepID=A0A345T613_9ACTN|nr:3-deoxy-7-phosphoheptulonate synthase [Peterkaempfera bronchialis]AXI81418.1 phospho-2-dehydro-3-deoxyheptonate aldolase [Peterkaempfera bronchialis]